MADRNLDIILAEADVEGARNIAAAWLTLTGTAIFHPCYDNDPIHGTTFVHHLQCQDCKSTFPPDQMGPPKQMPTMGNMQQTSTDISAPHPMGMGGSSGPMPLPVGAEPALPESQEMSEGSCPECGSVNVSPAIDEKGKQIGEELPNGKLRLEVFSPFETFVDLECRSEKELQQILARRRYPLDVIRRKFNHPELEGDNNSNVGGSIGLNLLRAIAYASGNAMYGTGIASGRNIGDDQSITVDQLWIRPCSDFPEGVVAIYANETLLNESSIQQGIPYRNRKGETLWPWHIARFDEVPGRMLGKTPMDDVAPKQEQRNKLESLIQLIITRCANPVWLMPKGLGVTEITGEPGQILEGNWGMDPRLKPERVPGDNVPTSIIAWLEKIDNDINELSGTFDVMKGGAPVGVTAGTALRLLLERANNRFAPVLRRLEKCLEKTFTDLLVIFQQFATEERINQIQGMGNTWEVQRFSAADIDGSVDVIVEAGSSIPRSIVGEQALIQDLTSMAVINPQNPDTQYKILEQFSSTNLLGDIDENIRQAQRENWRFTSEAINPVINVIIDNHEVHLQVHRQLALTSDYEAWPQQKRDILNTHILDHMAKLMPQVMPVQPGVGRPAVASGPGEKTNGGGPVGPSPITKQDTSQPPMVG